MVRLCRSQNMKKELKRIVKPIVERLPLVAATYRKLRDSRKLYERPKMTVLGFVFNGNSSMEQGRFEPEETRLVKGIFSKIDIVINVGANIGYYACLALNSKKYVFAFEPMELNLKYLLRNVKENGWENNIEIFPIALSNKAGIIEMYGSGTGASLIKGWAGTRGKCSALVPCSTMDSILGARFTNERLFFIVDIEGAEKMMFEGASRMLDFDPKPVWLVEISGAEHQPSGIKINKNLLSTFEEFWSRGYESRTADNRLREVGRDEIVQIMNTEQDTLGTHNFLFFEKGSTI